ncbi:MAG: tRNA pseudouridine(55) synthase TruB [Acidobacteriota bacterium]
MDGLLIIDKPVGPTSHDIVHQVKRLVGTKVGHTGTLDPLASGVLPLLVGRATRLARFFQGETKEYVAEIQLGTTTDTCDCEGRVIGQAPVPELSDRQLVEVLSAFRGRIRQQPPLYSAIKMQGKKLYELARRQVEVTPPQRTVEIQTLELLEWRSGRLRLRVECSAGTYVRSLARDIGQKIGCGAFLAALARTRSGAFRRADAISPSGLSGSWKDRLIPLENLLPELPRLDLDEPDATRIRHGNPILGAPVISSPHCRLFQAGCLIAIGRPAGDIVYPAIVLEPLSANLTA